MAASLPPMWLVQLFDNYGEELNGGTVESYAGGTSTPKATYTSATGLVANANPVVLDAAGRADIWLTPNEAYKFIIKNAAGLTIETVDGIVALSTDGDEGPADYLVHFTFEGTPGAQGFIGGHEFREAVNFPVDFEGSGAACETNPASDFVISIRKNGVEVGTVTITNLGADTYATTGGAVVNMLAGDRLTLWGPDAVGGIANIYGTIVGETA